MRLSSVTRSVVYSVALALALALASSARADEGLQPLEDLFEGRSDCGDLQGVAFEYAPESIVHEGFPGVFLPAPLAELVLCQVGELRSVASDLRLVDEELSLWALNESFLQDQIIAMEKSISFERSEAERLRSELVTSEQRQLHWTRHPGLWFGLGVVVTSLVSSVAATVL